MRYLFIVLFSSFIIPHSSFAAKPLNVLFIAVDDLRPELGCYGAAHMKTPHLDRLASQGMLFERAYCQVAVCNPSRSSVLSGTRPDTTGVLDNQHFMRPNMPDVISLPQHFKNHGYTSLSLGKIFHHSEREPGDDPQSWSEPAWYHGEPYKHWFTQESLDYVKQLKALPKAQQPKQLRAVPFEAADETDASYPDAQTATKAIETLQRLKADGKPFFLGVGFVKPHLPFVAPKKYWDLYDPAKIELAPNKFRPKDAPDYSILPGGELRNYHGIPEGSVPDDLARQLKHGYYASISYMDAQVGKLLDELDRLDLRKNTIIVLWGDHGWKLGEHDAWCKHTTTENDTNTALLLSVPGMQHAGAKTKSIVEFVDIYPTLVEFAGLPLPSHLEGMSFKPVVENPTRPWKTAAFSQYPRNAGRSGTGALMGYSMRTERYRLTVWVDRGDHTKVDAIELYDHQLDPQENFNVAKAPANGELVEQLMAQWRKGWQGAKPVLAKR
jgi:arylsulfatase A-like enzyme